MRILPLHPEVEKYLWEHQREKKFVKQRRLFEINPRHPSLRTELLEPRHLRIYSFRLDRKYRAIFIYRGKGLVEIIEVTDHYQ